jgi:RimJ/RimL family protein N-acetyltransferase
LLPVTTPRLTLRAFTAADAARLADYRSDPDVARHQSWSVPFSLEQAEQLIAAQGHLRAPSPGEWLQIAIERHGTLVGDVAVHLSEDGQTAEVGCTLAADQQGRGHAREAVAAVVEALFAEAGVQRIEARIDPRNEASIRLFQHLDFVHQGTEAAAVLIDGEWCDDALYALDRPRS